MGKEIDSSDKVFSASHVAPSPALSLNKLNAGYKERQVLFNIDAVFYKNKITSILGPSGCGKSTLISVCNRTLELTPGAGVISGNVFLNGNDIYDTAASAELIRKKIGIIFQHPITFPASIVENVLFGAVYHQKLTRQERLDYARHHLGIVGLETELINRLHEPAHKLSGGQRQRLCLARTLANQPEIILMDEPCSALDPSAMRHIEELIKTLSRTYTIIIVTHNIAQARRISDYTIVMTNGRIIEQDQTTKIFENPKRKQTHEFIEGLIG